MLSLVTAGLAFGARSAVLATGSSVRAPAVSMNSPDSIGADLWTTRDPLGKKIESVLEPSPVVAGSLDGGKKVDTMESSKVYLREKSLAEDSMVRMKGVVVPTAGGKVEPFEKEFNYESTGYAAERIPYSTLDQNYL